MSSDKNGEMHRLSSLPGAESNEVFTVVEQPPAPVLFLTSASTDISTLSSCLRQPGMAHWKEQLRALPLDCLRHPAQIDHYLATTASTARVLVVRLLGGRGHWSYGLEQCRRWQCSVHSRTLLVLAGTADQNDQLHPIGSISSTFSQQLALLLSEGGITNMTKFLSAIHPFIISSLEPEIQTETNDLQPERMADPARFDWKDEPGPRVGVLLYRAHARAADTIWCQQLLMALRSHGLVPRALWVSSLRDHVVQEAVQRAFQAQEVQLVISTTSFASVQFQEAGLGTPLWDGLDLPVLQLLSSGRSKQAWEATSQGLDPIDLSLQVVLPELDGRITTRIGAFREVLDAESSLSTAVKGLVPDAAGLTWLAEHARCWVDLRQTDAAQKRVALVLANYPVRNGRIANGVGLDTPASTVNILNWLAETGVELGANSRPNDSQELMAQLLSGRSNDPESCHLEPLAHLPLNRYLRWWRQVTPEARSLIESRWGSPDQAIDLEEKGFAVHGLLFGHVAVLIQPSRGYDPDQISDLHSPDLPPPHRYLAQYLWLQEVHGTQLMVHVGKHGSAEWLPGKSVGLSQSCGPALALAPIPHIYPFIVNDPGEGSQAKRRGHAVILDHLTPPLGRAGLHGSLLSLESLLDEYVEARQVAADRCDVLKQQIKELLKRLDWPSWTDQLSDQASPGEQVDDPWARCLDQVETYLCELKEAQIRTGLHRLGSQPDPLAQRELLLAIARSPSGHCQGLTQAMAHVIGLECDPWSDEDGERLSAHDCTTLERLGCSQPRRVSAAVSWLDDQALRLLEHITGHPSEPLCPALNQWLENSSEPSLLKLRNELLPRLLDCAPSEKKAFLAALNGRRIASGPSGAPTRGRPDVLPTGRNFYSVDLRGLPTEAAWDLGRRSAEQLLDLYRLEEGEDLRHLALSVWGTATMRNGGEDIAQMFALLGVRPQWDGPTRRMVDLEVVPLSLLARPRVDVTLRMSGLFRDAFPQLVGWVDRALQLVSTLDETALENPLAAITREEGPQARIFGSAPGAYGAGLQALIDSGQWDDQAELGEAFLAWSSWSYDGQVRAQANRSGLEGALRHVQVVLHNQDNREHDLLDSDDYYQFHGGMTAAVRSSGGAAVKSWFADHSRQERLRIHSLTREIDKVVRSRLLNPRWIKGMQQHGYKGAFEMGASLDYLFAYDASTNAVPTWCYGAICDQWLLEPGTKQFLSQSNPWVLRDMAERLLEAANRGLWSQPSPEQLQQVRGLVLEAEEAVEKGGLNC